MNENWKIETRAVQCGYTPGNGDPRVLPLYQSTTFKYDDAQSVADLFDLKRDGFFYTRLANPTVDAFEKRMAALEGGVAAVAVSAGQTATMLSMLNLASAGDHILAVSSLYGGTVSLLTNTFHKMGIEVSFVRPHDDSATVAAAIRPNTKAIFAEALANPALVVLDIERFAGIAHAAGIPLIVDNTFPTPCLCRPFEFGAISSPTPPPNMPTAMLSASAASSSRRAVSTGRTASSPTCANRIRPITGWSTPTTSPPVRIR